MRTILTTLLLFVAFTVSAQTWQTLDVDLDKENIESNPLKGLAANFGSDNGFPHSISNLTLSFGEVSTDVQGVFNFSEIDAFLEEQAQEGRYGIVQVNIDDSKLINPELPDSFDPDDLDENGNPLRALEAYKGAQHDLPAYLDNVPRVYYLGNRCPTCTAGTDANGNSIEPYAGSGLDPQGNPSLVVDYNNPALVAAMLDFISQLGARYDQDERMFIVHYGLYGIFGEWKLGFGARYVPQGQSWEMSANNKDLITRAYGDNFPTTNLIARFPSTVYEPQSVGYSDGLYFGGTFNDADPNQPGFFLRELTLFNSQENWRNQPIGGEMDPYLQGSIWGNDPNQDILQKVVPTGDPQLVVPSPQKIEDVLVRTHPTFIFQNYMLQQEFVGLEGSNHFVPSAANEADPVRRAAQFPFAGQSNQVFWDNAILATRRIGYSFYVDQFRITAENSQPAVEVNITNQGVAPMYADWDVEFGYLDANGQVISLGKSSNWNLSSILPSIESEGQVVEDNSDNKRSYISGAQLPDPNGTYTFLIRIVNPLRDGFTLPDGTFKQYPNASPVRFANTTQDEHEEGWLTLGEATLINGNLATHPEEVLSITSDPFSNTMNLGAEQQLSVTTVPANAEVTWKTNRPLTATVDQNGLVSTFDDRGLVTVTATASNGLTASFDILVSAVYELPALMQAESFSAISTDIDDGDPFNDFGVLAVASGPDQGALTLQRFKANSYVDFDVIVNEERGYIFDFRAANFGGAGDAKMDIILLTDNSTLGSVEFNRPAGGDNFDVYDSPSIQLPVGTYTLRFAVAESKTAFNLDWIRVRTDDPCDFPGFVAGGTCDDQNGNTIDDTFADEPDCQCVGIPGSARELQIPGLVQAEHWSGVSSNTFTANGIETVSTVPSEVITLPKYSPTVEGGDGYFVGGLDFLDRLDYNINATVGGDYTLGFRVAAPQLQGTNTASGEFTLKIDGITVQANFQLQDTDGPNPDPNDFGDYSIYEVQTTDPIAIAAGPHTFQIEVTIGSFDLNFIDFQLSDPCANFDISLIGTACDDGDPTTSNDVYTSTCECVGTPSTDVFTLIPALIEAEDFAELFSAQVNPAPAAEGGGDVIGFINDDTWIEYAVTVAEADDFLLDLRASSPFGIGNVDILDNAGNVLANVPLSPIVVANSFDDYGTFTSAPFALPAGSYRVRIDVVVSAFNLNWIEFRSANTCPNPVGTACDDGDPTTSNDVYTSTCECVGTPSTDVFTLIPALIEAEDFAELFSAQVNPAPAAEGGGDVIGFINDDTWIEYAVTVAEADDFVLDLRASSPFGIGNVDILDNAGNVLANVSLSPIVVANSFDDYGTFTSAPFALPAGSYRVRIDVVVSAFNLNWIEFRSANTCPNPVGTACDDGDPTTSNDVYTSTCECVGTPSTDVFTLIPALIEAEDFAELFSAQVNPAPAAEGGGDVIGFINDDTWIEYAVTVAEADDFLLDLRASSPFGIGNVDILDNAGNVLANVPLSPIVVANSFDDYGTFTSAPFALPAGSYRVRIDVVVSAFNLNWIEFKLDDACPNPVGSPCDDGNACTVNDVYTTDCGCAGTFADEDQDGVCDAEDTCPAFDNNLIGTSCDDGNACTVNDVYTTDCGCAGTFADEDQDGVCDAEDTCPAFDNNLIGTSCDDGNACTVNDVYTTDCGCAGTFADEDQDGVCDAEDTCPAFDNNLIGTSCDDGNACTVNDVYTTDCGCAGTFADEDQDGVCDAEDTCPAFDNNLIGTSCDDGNACTVSDVYTTDCGCAGTFADEDQDGVCDAEDTCPAFDNNLIGTSCDDGLACTINDVYTINCDCAGTEVDPQLVLESFNNSIGQFTVNSGAFSSSQPTYEQVTLQGTSVLLEVGGVDNSTMTDMSIGISTTFTSYGTDAIVELDYELLADEGYDHDEWTEAVLELDGQRVQFNGNDYLSRLVAGSPSTTGNTTAAIRLTGLAAGNHTLAVGLLNNKKTYNTELSTMRIDFISVTEDCSSNTCVVGAPCNDGNPATSNDAYTINCQCEGSIEVTLDPIHDAYLQGNARFNTDILRVQDPNRKTYMRFDLSGNSGTITAAELVLTVDNDPGNGPINVSKGSHTDWTETNLSNSNKPAATTLLGSLAGNFNQGETYTWNLNPQAINNEQLSLILEHISGNDVAFKSSENADVSKRPKLVVYYEATSGCTEGQSCDDGESCTENDVYDAACNCSGTYIGDVLVDEDFTNSSGAFTVTSGAFSSPKANYETFTQESTGVVLTVGGTDNSTETDMSLGLSTSFVANGTDDIAIQIDYELIVDEGYDHDEWTKAILQVDGQAVSYNGNDYLSQLIAGSPTTTGDQSVTLQLSGLSAGNHTLTVGLLNNKKTYNTERSEMIIDKIKITQGCPTGSNARIASTTPPTFVVAQTEQLENRSSATQESDDTFEMNVYPNPANDFFLIKYHAESSNALSISITDINGREVFTAQHTEASGSVTEEINTSTWAAGTYTVIVQSASSVKTERILILN